MNYKQYQNISKVALHQQKADLVLKNANVINVFTNEINHFDVTVQNGFIAAVGNSYEGREEIDLKGNFLLPGFIDAHLHLESTMVTPNELVSVAAAHGTTTFIVDPHEAANVCGSDGIDYILQQTEHSPANVYLMLPSCVPATNMDDNGCVFTAEKMTPYLSNPRVLGLGEVMDNSGVICGNKDLHKKLDMFRDKILDGHAPFLPDTELAAYAAAGICTDHEASSYEYALHEIRNGLHVHIREGSAAHNLDDIIQGILKDHLPLDNFSFCTDDKHIEDILKQGHINYNVKRAVELGMHPVSAVKIATINTARCYGLRHLGAIAPGYQADFVITDSLETFHILDVYHKGIRVPSEQPPFIKNCPVQLKKTVHLAPLNTDHFRLPITKDDVPVIRLHAQQITTEKEMIHIPETDNFLPTGTLNKIAAVERHKNTGLTGIGICKGYEIHGGAVASSVSHDSHNIIVVGDNDNDMVLAVNELIRTQGGYSLVCDGKVYDSLPLPIMGLISDSGFENVNQKLNHMIQKAHSMGVPEHIDPFITLSFLALPVIPALRITPRGLLDTRDFSLLSY